MNTLLAVPTPTPSATPDVTVVSIPSLLPVTISILALAVSVVVAILTYRRDRTSVSVALSASIQWHNIEPPQDGTQKPVTPVATTAVELDRWGPQPSPTGVFPGRLVSTVDFKARIANRGHRPVTVVRWFVEFGDGETRGVTMKDSPFEKKVRLEDGDEVEDEVLASNLLAGHSDQRRVRAVAEIGGGATFRSKWHTLHDSFPSIPSVEAE